MSGRSYELTELLSHYDGINDLGNYLNPVYTQPHREQIWIKRMQNMLGVVKQCPEFKDLYNREDGIDLMHEIFIMARCSTQHKSSTQHKKSISSELKLMAIQDEIRMNHEKQFLTSYEVKSIIQDAYDGYI